MADIQCKVCDSGKIGRNKRYKRGRPAVAIGYIFRITSVFGVLIAAYMLLLSGAAGLDVAKQQAKAIEAQLAHADVPDPIVRQVIAHDEVTARSLTTLSVAQRMAIESAEVGRSAAELASAGFHGAAIAGAFSMFVLLFSLCIGLLGRVLTREKRIVQCENCDALVQVS